MSNAEEMLKYLELFNKAQAEGAVPKSEPLHTSPLGRGSDDPNSILSQLDFEEEDEALMRESGDPYLVYMKHLAESKTLQPIPTDTIGPDNEAPKPVWTEKGPIEEVEKLKLRIHELECKLNAKEAGGKKWVESPQDWEDKKMFSQIQTLRSNLDDLSDLLGLQHEPAKKLSEKL
jgi:hypothetical protein